MKKIVARLNEKECKWLFPFLDRVYLRGIDCLIRGQRKGTIFAKNSDFEIMESILCKIRDARDQEERFTYKD